MQSIILPQSAFFNTQFGHPRFNPSPERLSVNLNRSVHDRGCSPRALPLPRSMSDTNPADSLETSGEPRRPGHPELSQSVTTAPGTFGPVFASVSPTAVEGREPALRRVVSASTSELSQRPFTVSDPRPRLPPPVFGGQTTSQSAESSCPPTTLATSPPGVTSRAIGQRPTRRTKAHVASACVNCKKKHLGCDSARPCRRCVLAGKSATCVDVTHKKRGRPPLKAEEASVRQYTTQMENAPSSMESQPPPIRRTHMHRATSSRELRPVTDLQFPGGGPGGMVTPTGQQRWTTPLFPPSVDPALSVPGSYGPGRYSASGPPPPPPAQVASGLVPLAPGFNPALSTGRVPPPPPYASPPLPLPTSPPRYRQGFPPPISPYMSRPPIGEPSPTSATRQTTYLESPVRLPPIFPAANPPRGPPGHRLSDPYPTLWTLRGREEPPQEHRPRPPSQGQIEPLSRHSLFPPPISSAAHSESPLIQSAPVAAPPERQPIQLPPTRPREEQQSAETESGEQRPAKRRKMALDDMVND